MMPIHRSSIAMGLWTLLTALGLLALGERLPASSGGMLWSDETAPGRSREMVVLEPPEGPEMYLYQVEEGGEFYPFQQPLRLTALEGEEREYRLSFYRQKDGRRELIARGEWLIDRKNPSPPRFREAGGGLQLESPEEDAAAVFYRVDTRSYRDRKEWQGEILNPRAYAEAYTVDAAGNSSRTVRWENSRKTRPESMAFDLAAPPSGIYVNRPWAGILTQGFVDCRYTLDGTDPWTNGRAWPGDGLLLEVPEEGESHLRAVPDPEGPGGAAGKELEESRRYRRLDRSFPWRGDGVPEPGFYQEPVVFQFPSEIDTVYYSLGDSGLHLVSRAPHESQTLRAPRGQWQSWTLRFSPDPPGTAQRRVAAVTYLHDNTRPVQPELPPSRVERRGRDRCDIRFDNPAVPGMELRYTLDGTEPNSESSLYRSGAVTLTAGEEAQGAWTVKAAVFSPAGRRSPVMVREIPYDNRPPGVPQVEKSSDGWIRAVPESEDQRVVYSVETPGDDGEFSEKPELPDRYSPVWDGQRRPLLINGMEGRWRFVFRGVDDAGNLSEPSEPVTAVFSRENTQVPEVVFQDQTLRIRGEGKIRYSLTRDGTLPPLPDRESPAYTEPVALELEEDRYNEFRVRAVSFQGEGRYYSPEYSYAVDKRVPRIDGISGVEYGEAVSRERVVLTLADLEKGVYVFYKITEDGQEPEKPGPGDPVSYGEIVFTCPPGEEKDIRIKMVPASRSSQAVGRVYDFRFAMDRKKPVMPAMTGWTSGALLTKGFTLDLEEPPEEDLNFYLRFYEDEEGEVLDRDIPLSFPKTVDVPMGEEKTFYFQVRAEDRGGNSVMTPEVQKVTIDKKVPAPPRFRGLPPTGASDGPVTLELEGCGSEIFYTRGRLGDELSDPDLSSQKYEEPLVFPKPEEGTAVYTLKAACRDDAGNWSSPAVMEPLFIDSRPVPPPEKPVRRSGESGESGEVLVEWPPGGKGRIFFRSSEKGEFRQYRRPFPLSGVSSGEEIVLEAYRLSGTGIPSDRVVYRLAGDGSVQGGEIRVEGLPDRGITAREIRLRIRGGDSGEDGGSVRYRLERLDPERTAEAGAAPERLSLYDPVYDSPVSVSGVPGESFVYRLSVQPWQGGEPAGGVQVFRWTTDRKGPPAPRITGLPRAAVVSEDAEVSLEGKGGSPNYRVTEIRSLEESRVIDEGPYRGPLKLKMADGEYREYLVEAWSEDDLGNRSLTVEERVIMDQAVVYVSPDGTDFNDGTRFHPVRSLERAREVARETGRREWFIQGGTYELRRPLVLQDDTVLRGGLDSNWEAAGERAVSSVQPDADWDSSRPVMELTGGRIEIRGLSFDAADGVVKTWLRNRGAQLQLFGLVWKESRSYSREFYSQIAGELHLKDSRLTVDGGKILSLLNILGGEALIDESVLRGGEADQGLILVSAGGEDTSVVVRESRLEPGRSVNTRAVEIRGGYLKVEDCVLGTGEAQGLGCAVRGGQARVVLRDSVISSPEEGRSSTLIFMDQGNLDVSDTLIHGAASGGLTLVQGKGISLGMERTRLIAGDTAEYIYPFYFQDSQVRIETCQLQAGTTRDYVGMRSLQGEAVLLQNTFLQGAGRNIQRAFHLEGGQLTAVNNLILRESLGEVSYAGEERQPRGEFFYSLEGALIEALGNMTRGYRYWRRGGGDAVLLGEPGTRDGQGNWSAPEGPLVEIQAKGVLRLTEDSPAVDRGQPREGLPETDWEGDPRSLPVRGNTPFPDIGADEQLPAD